MLKTLALDDYLYKKRKEHILWGINCTPNRRGSQGLFLSNQERDILHCW